MSKSIKIVLIFLVVAGVVGVGVYFGTKDNVQPGSPTTTEGETSLPGIQAGEQGTSELPTQTGTTGEQQEFTYNTPEEVAPVAGTKILYKEPVLGFTPTADGGVLLVSKNGTIVSVSPSGDRKELNSSGIENALEATFSTDGKKILLTYGKNTTPQFSVYDVASSTWQPLLADTAASLRPKTHEVVYLYEKSGVKNLFLWNLDKPKSTPQQISSLQIEDPILSWKDKDTLLIQQRPSAYTKDTLLSFNLSKKIVTPIIQDKYALNSIWNEAGSSGLVFYGDNTYRGGALRLYLAGGEEGSKLTLVTLTEKCSFYHSAGFFSTSTPKTTASSTALAQKNELYCAIPRDSKTFRYAILPDDFYRGTISTSDDLIKINLDDGSLGVILSPTDASLEIYKPFAGEKEIYFIDKRTGALYSVPNK